MKPVRISKSGLTKWYAPPNGSGWDVEKIKALNNPRVIKTDDGFEGDRGFLPSSMTAIWTAVICRDGTLQVKNLPTREANELVETLLCVKETVDA